MIFAELASLPPQRRVRPARAASAASVVIGNANGNGCRSDYDSHCVYGYGHGYGKAGMSRNVVAVVNCRAY